MEGVGNDDIIYYIINYVIGISGNRDTCSWNWRCGVYRSIRRCDSMYIDNSLDHEENPEKKKIRGSNRVSYFYIFTKLTAYLMERRYEHEDFAERTFKMVDYNHHHRVYSMGGNKLIQILSQQDERFLTESLIFFSQILI